MTLVPALTFSEAKRPHAWMGLLPISTSRLMTSSPLTLDFTPLLSGGFCMAQGRQAEPQVASLHSLLVFLATVTPATEYSVL